MNVHLLFSHPWTWLTGVLLLVLVHGVAPQLLLRLALACYPRHDPRRRELLADYATVPVKERPRWVLDVLTAGVLDGLRLRMRESRATEDGVAERPEEMGLSDILDRPTLVVWSALLASVVVEGFLMLFWPQSLAAMVGALVSCGVMAVAVGRLRWLARRHLALLADDVHGDA
ncbi:hypothetical protein [Allobranchiibius huperziae]|uniref:Uncharacterized protein n=1 Tax=Allobranchiibius huperziae TaxID=1874116 RepID=A0A853DP53_9MICO|nr:hypothetical protein [Allobranchiibius huperziae]NYJ76551.1 hypothetical protein [Allobranchiibius huperziae]